jgi:hypothetical protein
MDAVTAISLASSLMSLVLGGFAIWLALHLYSRSKDTERQVAVTLEAIKAQSEALQRLTGRWMDRFTKHATEPRPADEGLLTLVATVAGLPQAILSHMQVQPDASRTRDALAQEVVDAWIALYYYSAQTNVVAQAVLPSDDDFDPDNEVHTAIRTIVDRSAADFSHVANLLNGVNQDLVAKSSLQHLLADAIRDWQPYVRYTSQIQEARRAQGSD